MLRPDEKDLQEPMILDDIYKSRFEAATKELGEIWRELESKLFMSQLSSEPDLDEIRELYFELDEVSSLYIGRN